MRIGIGIVVLCLVCVGNLAAEEITFSVRLVDADAKPVEGAELGLMAAIRPPGSKLADKLDTEWYYNRHARSDANGVAQVASDEDNLDRLCLIARHEKRKIAALFCVDRKSLDAKSPIRLTLTPEKQIVGDVKCKQLDHDLGKIVVYVRFGGRVMLECLFDTPTYKLSLPPGDFEIEAYSSDADSARKSIVVKEQSLVQEIDAIDLPATKIALLAGHAAPELADVVAWKNTKPITLESLRGKCVLLEFWGHWCGPCVQQMPELFALHDKYAEQGLVIIGVHVGFDIEPDRRVDTADKLDERLADTRKTLWAGRDLPFPVALATSNYKTGADGTVVRIDNPTVASYGIHGYPTQVLIDRKGNVTGLFAPNEKGIALLEKALAEK